MVLDREYGNATWVLAQAEIKADSLMRLRRNACLWSAPPVYSGRGRPRKHGQKMSLGDPETWADADAMLEIADAIAPRFPRRALHQADEHPQLGQVRVRQWQNLHFYRAAGHPFPPLWLAWVGARTLPLATVWFKYLRRFGVDHWYRFAHRNDCIGHCLI